LADKSAKYFLYSKILLFFLLKISTRYPHLGDSAEIGKICSVSGCPKFGIVDSFLELFNQSF
jgi:hypothetical protein